MLSARSQKAVGQASLRSAFAISPRVGVAAIERSGVVYDTRFVPGDEGPARPFTVLYVVVRGTLAIDGGSTHVGPAVFAVTEAELEGCEGRRTMTFRSSGDPYGAVEIHVRDEDLTWPPEEPLGADFFAACAAFVEHASESDDALFEHADRVLGVLHDEGVLAGEARLERSIASAAISRLWSTVRPAVESLSTLASLKELGGASPRQTQRDIETVASTHPIVRGGWRSIVRRFRLKLAVLLLSAADANVGTVAREVGYGSADAMARAFRDARLPSPSDVQRSIRERQSEH